MSEKLAEKLDVYDTLAVLVPGVLVVGAISLLLPGVSALFTPSAKLPEGFGFICLTALSVFVGHLVQAIASLLERPLNWSWGGRPSERALAKGLGDRFLPADAAKRIRGKLVAKVGAGESDRSLFLYAMQTAESCGSSRVAKFNALYGYHRVLFVLSVIALALFLASLRGGVAAHLTWKQNAGAIITLVALAAILWNRAKQRGYYYVREVLCCAEQQLAAAPEGKDE